MDEKQILTQRYHFFSSNCQHFSSQVFNHFAKYKNSIPATTVVNASIFIVQNPSLSPVVITALLRAK